MHGYFEFHNNWIKKWQDVLAGSLITASVVENEQTRLQNCTACAKHLRQIYNWTTAGLGASTCRLIVWSWGSLSVQVVSAGTNVWLCNHAHVHHEQLLCNTEFNQCTSAFLRQLQSRKGNVCYRGDDDNLNSTGIHWRSTKGHWSHAIHAPCMIWIWLRTPGLVFQQSF